MTQDISPTDTLDLDKFKKGMSLCHLYVSPMFLLLLKNRKFSLTYFLGTRAYFLSFYNDLIMLIVIPVVVLYNAPSFWTNIWRNKIDSIENLQLPSGLCSNRV